MIFRTYLIREFLRYTSMIVAFFALMYSVIDFLEKNARYFPKYNTPGDVILEYYLLQLPKMSVELLPFATLFGAIITLWLFSRSGEIAAARAAGASISAVGVPLLASGLALSVLSFLVSEWVVPKAQNRLRYVETVKVEGSRLSRMFLESNWIRSGGSVLHFESYDRIRGVLRSPTLYVFAAPNALQRVARSSRAFFDPQLESWVMLNAVETYFPQVPAFEDATPGGGKEPLKLSEDMRSALAVGFVPVLDTRLTAEPPRILSANVGANDLGFLELLQLMRESEQAGISAQKRLVDLYQKVSLPLANMLFIFLALPFAIRQERQSDTYTGVLVALCLSLLYWAGNFSLRTLAQSTLVPPLFGAFAMSFLLFVFGIWQLGRLNRRI